MMAVAAAQKNREMFAIKKSYSIENGYPARRRSLVDDARFETLVVKQTKQSVLEEARQRSNDSQNESIAVPAVQQAKITTQKSVEYEEIKTAEPIVKEPLPEPAVAAPAAQPKIESQVNGKDAGLTEEEVILQNSMSEDKEVEAAVQRASMVLRLKEGMGSLARILKTIENFHGTVVHLESRPGKTAESQYDVLVKVDMSKQALLLLIRSLRQSSALAGVTLLADNSQSITDPWFPKHARDLDNCNHLMTKYDPDLDMNHPGFADKEYRGRRKMIADIAFAYKYGDPIPHIDYTETEVATWGMVFKNVKELMPKHFCAEYRQVFAMLEEEGIFGPNRIPQLQDMSDFLNKNTGFILRPCAGLLTARDFLASLAFRVFQSTQYVRHTKSPFHTPEPDCIHEILGHMPLLADPSFAQFSQEIGLASLGASDEEIEKLSTVYWFTVEFGLCKENGEVKAYGAGLLSAYGELLHAISDKPEHRPFDPQVTAVQPYQDQEYQPIYYVAESFEDAKEKFRRWVSEMSRPYEVRFNPHTQRIEILDSVERLDNLMGQLNLEMLHLNTAINKLKNKSV
ncbi:tyrosine 3-monooxygenase-like [Macrosteles quadrilineatus]|uniref:tyrosine 3-monooxygenase-like n=1 Tax=Macrosteles quadrilineatus TaxID=74068 RepID=UPI0023E1BBFB|nr:tyrosine 3-monooxygenase-like [Macrosteles quadrilineatus]XP_054274449.1 tyrosine 3-monooxygenase-like [Macrosteles quadrilineatus]